MAEHDKRGGGAAASGEGPSNKPSSSARRTIMLAPTEAARVARQRIPPPRGPPSRTTAVPNSTGRAHFGVPAGHTITTPQLPDGGPDGRRQGEVLKGRRQGSRIKAEAGPNNRFPMQPPSSSEGLEREVLGGQLWHAQCREASGSLPARVPESFTSVQQYVSTFTPLLCEEAREALRSGWADALEARDAVPVDVVADGIEGGSARWVTLQLSGGALERLRENDVLVLTSHQPDRRQPLEWLDRRLASADAGTVHQGNWDGGSHAGEKRPRGGATAPPPKARKRGRDKSPGGHDGGGGRLHVVAAVVRQTSRAAGGIVAQACPGCEAHVGDTNAPCMQVLSQLRERGRWWLVKQFPLTTQTREYNALQKMSGLLLRESLLQPERLRAAGEALAHDDMCSRMWPVEAASPGFFNHLRSQCDMTQLRAVELCCHFLGARGLPGAPIQPLVLIQGPPGTGKTHTVVSILNAWHLVHYQRYFSDTAERLVAAARAAADRLQHRGGNGAGDGSGNGSCGVMDAAMAQISASAARAPLSPNTMLKPRLLVAAPSNAAVDELLNRIMAQGFVDRRGELYRPNVLRVGSAEATLSPSAREVWVDTRIQRYMQMAPADWHNSHIAWQERTRQLRSQLSALQLRLGTECGDSAAPLSGGELEELQRKLPPLHNELNRAGVELERLNTVQAFVMRTRGAPPAAVRDALEESFIREAEMVFTTLSSTGRRIFGRLRGEFEAVLIDEAAQATELATLQALVFGCKQVVLVGDPQQLPATVLSQRAAALRLDRSLFERLQAGGCPAHMLAVQYRMHPAIRSFPSNYFYGGQLRDAESVTALPPELYYDHGLLRPYVLFDVAHGAEARNSSGSVSNQAEALLAACLFYELRSFLIRKARELGPGAVPRVSVGVITPYRQQRDVLRDTFQSVVGPEAAAEAMIETVDSFQGKQLDVVILSCVRASSGRGVGFVSDVRRMNVAITRARRAMWIVGNVETLQNSPQWAALVQDARDRGLVIDNAVPAELFPDHPHLQRGGQGKAQGSSAGQQGQRETAAAADDEDAELYLQLYEKR